MEPTAAAPSEGRARRGFALSPYTVVPAALLLGGILLFAAESGWYRILLAIHVFAVIAWLGGGIVLTTLALQAERANDNAGLARILGAEQFLGQRIYSPAALVLVATGFGLAEKHGWSYGDFWLVFGIVIWFVSALTGMAFFGRQMPQVNALVAERGIDDPEVQRRIRLVLRVARFDVTLLLLAVADMIMKPFL